MPSRSTRSNVLGAISAGAIVVVFCLILLWHDPLLFWNDDYELSVLPVFADVARSWTEGRLPILSPYSWVCGNLAGEFQYGTFSIFVNAAVILIWKFPLTFAQQAAALSITHLFVLAAGAFLLARGRNFSTPLSIFVALIAALNGWIICWGATDWFGALGAFAWLPWTWWALEKSVAEAVRSGASAHPPRTAAAKTLDRKRLMIAALWPAPFVYLVITGGFPYTVLMLALLIGWLSIKSVAQTKSIMSILPMLCGVALGAGLAAPAWLALLDYVTGSARQIQASTAHWQWIVPWRALPGLILPCWTVNWADFSTRYLPHTGTELACGLVAPAALIAACISHGRSFVRQMKWELFLLLLLLILCTVPTTGVFRWSFRWLPFFHLVLALCAAEGLRLLPRSAITPAIALFLIGVGAIAMSILHLEGSYAFPLTWILLVLAVLWLALELMLTNESLRAWTPVSVTFVALFATYLCIPPNCGVPKYNLDQKLLSAGPLDPQRLYLSIYPPAEHTYRVEKKPQPVGQIVRPGST